MERSTQYLGYHTLNKVHALESANVSASAHKVASSLDPSKPLTIFIYLPPPSRHLMAHAHAMPPHLMFISYVRLLLHLAARVAPIVVAHLAAPPRTTDRPRPPMRKFRCLTYRNARYAALAHGALRARHGVADLS